MKIPINQVNQSRLAQLSISLLKSISPSWSDQINVSPNQTLLFRMKDFLTDSDWGGFSYRILEPKKKDCATCCCFLGFSPFVFSGIDDWTWPEICEYITGYPRLRGVWPDPNKVLFSFLFSEQWPDDPMEAAARVRHLLQGNDISPHMDFHEVFLKDEDTIESLIEELKQFL